MDRYALNEIRTKLQNGNFPPTIGHEITERQFLVIADLAARNIYNIGWDEYLKYMNLWRLKITQH